MFKRHNKTRHNTANRELSNIEKDLEFNVPSKDDFADLDLYDDGPENLNTNDNLIETNNDMDDYDSLNLDDNLDDNISNSITESRPAIERSPDLLKKLTSFKKYFNQIQIEWLGLVWDSKQNKYVPDKDIEPIANIKFVKWAIPYMKTFIRDNNIIVHLRKDEYVYLMEDAIKDVYITLGIRQDEFGIKDLTTLMTLSSQITNAISLMLLGAGDGKYIKLLTETTNRNESVRLDDGKRMMDNKVSFADKMKGMLFGSQR